MIIFVIPACAGMTGKKRPICPRLQYTHATLTLSEEEG